MTLLGQTCRLAPRTFPAKFWCLFAVFTVLVHFRTLKQLENKTKDNSNLQEFIVTLNESHKSLNKDLAELENLDDELIRVHEQSASVDSKTEYSPKINSDKKCWEIVKEKKLLVGREQEAMNILSKQENPPTESDFTEKLEPGIKHGCWAPNDCSSDKNLVVIVPYRHRPTQLTKLLYRLHSILQRQRRTYCIIVSEQYDLGQFNRGKLMNTGYLQSFHHDFFKIHGEPQCFAFHDVDLLPEDDRNLFVCIENTAVHICDKLNKYEYHTQYTSGRKVSAGGSVLISKKHYEAANGHSNWFWGWGVEDIDMASRIRCHTPDFPENSSFNKTEENEEYFKLSTGLTREGGDWGLFRQDSYGQMTQIDHKHGFTNGPAHSKLAVGNNFVTNIARSNLHFFRRWRVGSHQTYANENITKIYNSPSWDGFKNTNSHLRDTVYSKYFTKYTFDIRPAKILKDSLMLNNERIYTATPEIENLHKLPNLGVDECQYMMYEDAFIDKGEIGSFAHDARKVTPDSRAHARLNYWSRLKNGMRSCDDHFTKYYGQCNAFSLRRPLPQNAPVLVKSTNETDCDDDRVNEVWMKHCPHMGWFQVVEKPAYTSFENDESPPHLKIHIAVVMEMMHEDPVGGLIYADKIHFEGQKLNSRFMDIGRVKKGPFSARNDYPHSEARIDFTPMDLKPRFYTVNIIVTLKGALPGIYLMNVKIIDRVGEPYFDKNVVFRLKSDLGRENDIQVRKDFANHNYVESNTTHNSCIKMEKNAFESIQRDEIAKHFGIYDHFIYRRVNHTLEPKIEQENIWARKDLVERFQVPKFDVQKEKIR